MNELKIFNNPEFGEIRTVIIDGEPWFVGKDMASALGYTDLNHSILDHVDSEDRVNSKTQGHFALELGQRGSWLINESGMYSLIFGSKLESAKKFKKWVTSEVLPSIRKTGTYGQSQLPPNTNENTMKFLMCLQGVKFLADDLRVAESSRLLMYNGTFEEFGLPTSFLPHYEDNGNRERCSATELLKRNGCGMSAAKFNQLLIMNGFLEIKERKSSQGGTKEYKSLTDDGLKYGVNLINEKNQNETQPHYYANTFMELYNMVTA